MLRKRIAGAGLLLALFVVSSASAAPSWRPLLETRARYEIFDTPVARSDQDSSYGFGLLRVRAGVEAKWSDRASAHLLLQGAAMSSLPAAAGFASGPVYLGTNGGDRTPAQAGLLELAFHWKSDSWAASVGRQGFVEGFGKPTGIAFLDGAKRRRLAERLIGNLDFPNVGRRWDGAVVTAGLGGAGQLELYAFRPLAGAFHYDDALEELDIDVYGGSYASGFGAWLPASEISFFAIGYRDSRDVARRGAGDVIELQTYGASWLAGSADWSVLGWCALQRGDYGNRSQSAWAALAEISRRFGAVRGAPSVHLGFETASGGGSTGERKTFFNLLPTNHKFYGSLDYSAFSNLRDLYAEVRWAASAKLSLTATIHDFGLVDRSDAWYGGSGAFSERELGYAARRPASGRFESSALGQELDLSAQWSLPSKLGLRLDAGWFFGGSAAGEILRQSKDGAWGAVELSWKL